MGQGPDTLNLREGKVENRFELTCIGKEFLNRTYISQTFITIINKWGFMKIETFISKGHHHLSNAAAYRMGEVFNSYISDRSLISRLYNKLKKPNKIKNHY